MRAGGKKLTIFGCGYLGERVAAQAVERGFSVTALTRNEAQAQRLGAMGLERVIVGELDRPDWHPLVNSRQDYVVNCVSSAGGGWSGYRRSYYDGMQSLLDWAAGGEVARLIFTSSTSVYGQSGGEWVTEEMPAAGSSEGGKILLEAEALLAGRHAQVESALVLRLGGIYGPGRHHLLNRALRPQIEEEEGDDAFLNSIHVDDACGAVLAGLSAPDSLAQGTFNIVDDRPSPKGEIVRWLHEQAKERGLLRCEAEAVCPPRRQRSLRSNRRISNLRAKEALAWRPQYPDFRSGYLALLDNLERE